MTSVLAHTLRRLGFSRILIFLRDRQWRFPLIKRLIGELVEFPQIRHIMANSSPPPPTDGADDQKILFFSMRAWSRHLASETVIAHGLKLRGARCEFYTCGGRLPICDITSFRSAPPMPCHICAPYARRFLDLFGFPPHQLADFVGPADFREAEAIVDGLRYEDYDEFRYLGLPLGRLVATSVLWFLCSGLIGQDQHSRDIHRKFLISGVIMAKACRAMLDKIQPDTVVLLNGLFFPERILWETAQARGIPVVTYERGFLINTLVFARNRSACYFEVDEAWQHLAGVPLTESQNAELDEYLLARRRGQRSLENYWPSLEEDMQAICRRLRIDRGRPVATMFTNILWDSAIQDKDIGFDSMFDWIDHTIEYFTARPDKQLIIRAHPAEVRLVDQEARERVADHVLETYHDLPHNIKIVPPQSDVSSYTLMSLSDVGLVYTSTTGLELALEGVPTLVAGEPHYRGKGFTLDVATKASYHHMLDEAWQRGCLSDVEMERARRYAYLFFFRFMIPFPLVNMLGEEYRRFNFASLSQLAPGCEENLDLICAGILEGKPFLRTTENA